MMSDLLKNEENNLNDDVLDEVSGGAGGRTKVMTCPACGGKSLKDGVKCPTCKGHGVIEK